MYWMTSILVSGIYRCTLIDEIPRQWQQTWRDSSSSPWEMQCNDISVTCGLILRKHFAWHFYHGFRYWHEALSPEFDWSQIDEAECGICFDTHQYRPIVWYRHWTSATVYEPYSIFNPLTPTVAMGTAIKHLVPDRVKPSFVTFDNRALWRSALNISLPGCQKLQMTACLTQCGTWYDAL